MYRKRNLRKIDTPFVIMSDVETVIKYSETGSSSMISNYRDPRLNLLI